MISVIADLSVVAFMPKAFRGHQPKSRTVADTASRLNVSEFEVFRIAYENWYGHVVPEREIERCFEVYLTTLEIPMWVRAFAREVYALDELGQLDPTRFGISARSPTTGWLVCLGGMAFVVMIMLVVLLIYLAERSADSTTAGCFFPPCY